MVLGSEKVIVGLKSVSKSSHISGFDPMLAPGSLQKTFENIFSTLDYNLYLYFRHKHASVHLPLDFTQYLSKEQHLTPWIIGATILNDFHHIFTQKPLHHCFQVNFCSFSSFIILLCKTSPKISNIIMSYTIRERG